MTRRPGIESDRLTFRGVHPELKRALLMRGRSRKTSMEKTVIAILEEALQLELAKVKLIDEIECQVPVG